MKVIVTYRRRTSDRRYLRSNFFASLLTVLSLVSNAGMLSISVGISHKHLAEWKPPTVGKDPLGKYFKENIIASNIKNQLVSVLRT